MYFPDRTIDINWTPTGHKISLSVSTLQTLCLYRFESLLLWNPPKCSAASNRLKIRMHMLCCKLSNVFFFNLFIFSIFLKTRTKMAICWAILWQQLDEEVSRQTSNTKWIQL